LIPSDPGSGINCRNNGLLEANEVIKMITKVGVVHPGRLAIWDEEAGHLSICESERYLHVLLVVVCHL